jgi:hypothetical protein
LALECLAFILEFEENGIFFPVPFEFLFAEEKNSRGTLVVLERGPTVYELHI